MAGQPQKKKKAPKKIATSKLQLAEGVVVPTGRKVKLVMAKEKFYFSV